MAADSLEVLLAVAKQRSQPPDLSVPPPIPSNKRKSDSNSTCGISCPALHLCSDQCATASCIAASTSSNAHLHSTLTCCIPSASTLCDLSICQEEACHLEKHLTCQSVSCELEHTTPGASAALLKAGQNVCWDLDVCTGACSPDNDGNTFTVAAVSSPCSAQGCVSVCDGVLDVPHSEVVHSAAGEILCDPQSGSVCTSTSTQCGDHEVVPTHHSSEQAAGRLYSTFAELLECCCCSEYYSDVRSASSDGLVPACTADCAPCFTASVACEECPPCVSVSSPEGSQTQVSSHNIASSVPWQWHRCGPPSLSSFCADQGSGHLSHLSAAHSGLPSPGLTISTSTSYSTAPTPHDSPDMCRPRSTSDTSVGAQTVCTAKTRTPSIVHGSHAMGQSSHRSQPSSLAILRPENSKLQPSTSYHTLHEKSLQGSNVDANAVLDNELARQCDSYFSHLHDDTGFCQVPSTKECDNNPQSLHAHWDAATSHLLPSARGSSSFALHACSAHDHGHHVCQWADCGKSFSSVESLVAHVNASHLLGGNAIPKKGAIAKPTDQLFISSDNVASISGPEPFVCQWGNEFHTIPAWQAGGDAAASTPWDAAGNQTSIPILQHLLTDHLGCDPRHILHGVDVDGASAAEIEMMLCSFLPSNADARSLTMEGDAVQFCRREKEGSQRASQGPSDRPAVSLKRKLLDVSEPTVGGTTQSKKTSRLSGQSLSDATPGCSDLIGKDDARETARSGSHACGWSTCSELFDSTEALTAHIISEHVGSGEAEYKCCWRGCERAESGRKFAQRQKVLRHIQSHTGDRPFACPHCPKRFQDRNGLVQHVRTHTSERPFVCEICSKAFVTPGSLTIHRRTHTGAKPFECSECGKRFSESSNLTKHMRIHTGERPYPCPECGKAFVRPDQVTRHMTVHRNAAEKAADGSRRQ